jgi:ABC-2 type transport system permease protein
LAVYKRTYKGYDGPVTAAWSRFTILPRYSYARLFQSKFLVIYLVACFFFPLGCGAFIYIAHNLSFLKTLNIPVGNIVDINGRFFYIYAIVQDAMGHLLAALVGPSLVSPDLVNNALPLYLGRPFSRTEYVLGKMSVLMWLLALITWIPGLLLFWIQASLAGWDWTKNNLWIAWGIFIGPLVWNAILSLIAVSMSAWVRWKIAAGALILGVFFAGAGFGAAINGVMRTSYGALVDLAQDNAVVWAHLFRLSDVNLRVDLWDAISALGAACVICLWLLFKKVRAFEVVK